MVRFHHYLPQFLLRGFADASHPPPREPFVCVYERGSGTVKRRAPKNIAGTNSFYRLDALEAEDPEAAEVVEEWLAAVESAAAPAVRRTVEAGRVVSADDRDALALFVAAMERRSPSRRLRVLRDVRAITEKHARDGIDLSRDGALFLDMATRNIHSVGLPPQAEGIADLLRRMRHCVIHAEAGTEFVLSDAPVRLSTPAPAPPEGVPIGFLLPHLNVELPISPSVSLLFSKNRVPPVMTFSQVQVGWFNRLYAMSAARHVFARSEDEALTRHMASLPPSDQVGGATPIVEGPNGPTYRME